MPRFSPIIFGVRRPSQSIPLLATPPHSSTHRATPCPAFSHPYLQHAPCRASTLLDRPIQTISQHAPLFSHILPTHCISLPSYPHPNKPRLAAIFSPPFNRASTYPTSPFLCSPIPARPRFSPIVYSYRALPNRTKPLPVNPCPGIP